MTCPHCGKTIDYIIAKQDVAETYEARRGGDGLKYERVDAVPTTDVELSCPECGYVFRNEKQALEVIDG